MTIRQARMFAIASTAIAVLAFLVLTVLAPSVHILPGAMYSAGGMS